MEDIAAAARDAGLQFVVFTDHGDGTRAPEPPAYRHGVLTIDGVEISTSGGHYAVLGMAQSPYPLAGEPRDVVEDVARLGGFGVVAHGDSPRNDLGWTDWTAAVNGLEWLSLDTAWRRASTATLARAFTTYWFRPGETLGALLSPPADLIARFDALTQTRRVVSLASTDAHGPVLPSYEACFRTMTTRVQLDAPLTGDPARDGKTIVDALRDGRHFTAIDGLGEPAEFTFAGSVAGSGVRADSGGVLPSGQDVIFEVRATGADDAEIVLRRNGEIVRRGRTEAMIYQADGRAATYRVEVHVPGSAVPWILSNPIYVGLPVSPPLPPLATPSTTVLRVDRRQWGVGHDPTSSAVFEPVSDRPDAVVFRYRLGDERPGTQSASLMAPIPADLAGYAGLTFEATASAPMRVGVQLVQEEGGIWSRWHRSVFLDRDPRPITVLFRDMTPVSPAEGPPPLKSIQALVFVVDANNTKPGARGEIIFNHIAYQR